MINSFLAQLTAEIRTSLYDAFGACMHVVILMTLLIKAHRAGLNKKGALQLFVSFYAAFFTGNIACNVLGSLTEGVIPKINLGVAFLVFLVVLALLLRFVKAPVLQFMDAAIPVFILGRGIGIIGCFFPGCCHGFPAEWGIYSNSAGTTVVPTVLIDMVVSYIIVVYLLMAEKKHPVPGVVAAKGILLFGILRYVIDVLRDNNKLLGMITVEGICGIVYALTGLFLLYGITQHAALSKDSIVQSSAQNFE